MFAICEDAKAVDADAKAEVTDEEIITCCGHVVGFS